jgi:tRNA dimethylallyltransferase
VKTLVVDSMQVYKEIPTITNQARRRPAVLVGVISVTEEWTVAEHRRRVDELTSGSGAPFVLDAGTGMYLNAVLLDIPLAGKVPESIRRKANELAEGAENPRRAARENELRLVGAPERGSIWEGPLRYGATLLYLRPPREVLDRKIELRSRKIAREGAAEAEKIREMQRAGLRINPSVLDSIGVRELLQHVSGGIPLDTAEERINARTRRLTRRQIRWFDKLARSLQDSPARVLIIEDPADPNLVHTMHDIMGSW